MSATTLLAGVMGWPVAHSRSPRLHGHWLRRYGIDGAYLPLAVPPERIEAALRGLPALGFRGCNVTIPHKGAAAALVDRLDPLAARLGAVNTVIVQPDGALTGSNTDGQGFMANLRAGAPGWQPAAGPAVVLGAGGAASAVLAALADARVPRILLVNRSPGRAEALAARLGGPIEVRPWAERDRLLAAAALLVNTTSLGMAGQPALEIDLDALPRGAVVTDLVYAPLRTALLTAARARGARTVDGLGMLLHQARPGFAAWFGVEPQVDEALRAAVLAER